MDTSFETFEDGGAARPPRAGETPVRTPSEPQPVLPGPEDGTPRAWYLSPLHIRLILLVAVSMLPLLILTGVVVFQSYDKAREDAGERVLQTTRSAISSVDRELHNHIAALEVLALSPALHAGDFETFRSEAERFLSRFPGTGAGIGVTDVTGHNFFTTSTVPGVANIRRTDQETVAKVFSTGKPQVSNLYLSAVSKRVTFTVDVPVIKDGQVIYDLVFNPPLAIYQDIIKNLNLPEDWVVSIFDRNLSHVVRLPPRSDGTTLTTGSPSLRAAVAGGNNIIAETISLEGQPIITAFSRSEDSGWMVAIGIPVDTLSAPARRSIFMALGLGIGLMMLGLFAASRLATQRMRAEAHRDLLVNELNHRVKNTLSTVQAIVARGLRDAPAAAPHKKAIETRLLALSHAHNILSEKNWESADLRELATSILEPYVARLAARAHMQGPQVTLKPRIAIALAMTLNELATNAAKYGALSSPTGTIDITWTLRDGTPAEGHQAKQQHLRLEWRESGGPPVTPPTKPGYGTRFIERAVGAELKGSYSAWYPTQGVTCVIEIPL
jgi:two-component sensor histidine kinase